MCIVILDLPPDPSGECVWSRELSTGSLRGYLRADWHRPQHDCVVEIIDAIRGVLLPHLLSTLIVYRISHKRIYLLVDEQPDL